MIRREFKVNLKSFIIWTSILIGMFLVVDIIYPYIITNDTKNSLTEMMKVFPKEVLQAFNMDISAIDTAYGWFKTEGFTFVLLIVGVYSSIMGANILLKEESEGTIEYLNSVPIKRRNIVFNKIIVSLFYIIMMILLVGIFNYVALLNNSDFNFKQYLLLSITPLFIAIPLFSINLFISTFLHKTKKTLATSLGIVFIFYFLQIVSELSDKVSFLKYFTIYTLADTRNVIKNVVISPLLIVVCFAITIFFIGMSFIRYERKELV